MTPTNRAERPEARKHHTRDALRRPAISSALDRILRSDGTPDGTPGAASSPIENGIRRQCEIVRRYDLELQSKAQICRDLGISRRTFYRERQAFFARINASMSLPASTAVAPVEARGLAVAADSASLLAAHFRNADVLYQVDAMGLATEALERIIATVPDENAKISGLSRLVDIACGTKEMDEANAHLLNARACAERAGLSLSARARGELTAAEAMVAWSSLRGSDLESAAVQLTQQAAAARDDQRLWALNAQTLSRVGVFRYHVRNLSGALDACRVAAYSLERAGDEPPTAHTLVYTTRAVVDAFDVERAHLSFAENADAYMVAVKNGMLVTASDALYNIVTGLLFSDGDTRTHAEKQFVQNVLRDAATGAFVASDALCAAAVAAALGKYDEAIAEVDRAYTTYLEGPYDWTPTISTLKARILYKAGRFVEAEEAARQAIDAWMRSGTGGEGLAMRIQAEALEAIGQTHAATSAIAAALDALAAMAPVHHRLGAYRAAYRLAPKRAYLDQVHYLTNAFRRPAVTASSGVQSAFAAAASEPLTRREREVALRVAEGCTNPQIARQLGISTKTVANHVASIFERLGIRARWQLTRDLVETNGR